MEIGDWITLSAVIVALGIGIASILLTQSLQKKDRKERLLNEINQWVTDIISNWHNFNVDTECKERTNINENLFGNWRDISARSDRIEIITNYFNKDMGQLVNNISSLIMELNECIRDARRGEINAEFPKEWSIKSIISVSGKYKIDKLAIHIKEDGTKVIEQKELASEYWGLIYTMASDLLEMVGKIENKKQFKLPGK